MIEYTCASIKVIRDVKFISMSCYKSYKSYKLLWRWKKHKFDRLFSQNRFFFRKSGVSCPLRASFFGNFGEKCLILPYFRGISRHNYGENAKFCQFERIFWKMTKMSEKGSKRGRKRVEKGPKSAYFRVFLTNLWKKRFLAQKKTKKPKKGVQKCKKAPWISRVFHFFVSSGVEFSQIWEILKSWESQSRPCFRQKKKVEKKVEFRF